ncbi:unnamed protein product [Alopecurus aequalis]
MPSQYYRRQLVAVAALVSVLLWRPAGGTEYQVGGDGDGWDTGINYAAWAQAHSFAAGDVLGQYLAIVVDHGLINCTDVIILNSDMPWLAGVVHAVFEYVKNQHNVYEVTEAAYRSCDATAPGAVLAAYTSGFDRVVLPEARTYWFICQIPNHCIAGMKLAVNVSGIGAPAPSPSPAAGAA